MASTLAQGPATCAAHRMPFVPFKVNVFFSSAGVRVAVQLPGPVDASARRAYNSGQRQCCNHLLSHPPKGFDVEVSGGLSAPVIEVKIQPCLLQQLPVLADIHSAGTSISGSTCDPDDEFASRTEQETAPASIELPCSIWGLVSLLIFTEGVSLRRWFQGNAPDCDPSLPVQTLEVCCCFRACVLTLQNRCLKPVLSLNDLISPHNSSTCCDCAGSKVHGM